MDQKSKTQKSRGFEGADPTKTPTFLPLRFLVDQIFSKFAITLRIHLNHPPPGPTSVKPVMVTSCWRYIPRTAGKQPLLGSFAATILSSSQFSRHCHAKSGLRTFPRHLRLPLTVLRIVVVDRYRVPRYPNGTQWAHKHPSELGEAFDLRKYWLSKLIFQDHAAVAQYMYAGGGKKKS